MSNFEKSQKEGRMQEKEKEGISRKEFVKLVGTGAAVVAGTAFVQPLVAAPGSTTTTKPAPADRGDLFFDFVPAFL